MSLSGVLQYYTVTLYLLLQYTYYNCNFALFHYFTLLHYETSTMLLSITLHYSTITLYNTFTLYTPIYTPLSIHLTSNSTNNGNSAYLTWALLPDPLINPPLVYIFLYLRSIPPSQSPKPVNKPHPSSISLHHPPITVRSTGIHSSRSDKRQPTKTEV
ncbi:uncharacterized protein RJT20DRAFT_55500 [Scheffersomyces xylosifermentans]|uniref:uncharacterized protein n=1 Tax=Scheffersomyces xylosifermentans TaxID=1304137 RepID=UPI00315DC5B3